MTRKQLRDFVNWLIGKNMIDGLTIDYEVADEYLSGSDQSFHPNLKIMNRDKLIETIATELLGVVPIHKGPFVSNAEARRVGHGDNEKRFKIAESMADAILELDQSPQQGVDSQWYKEAWEQSHMKGTRKSLIEKLRDVSIERDNLRAALTSQPDQVKEEEIEQVACDEMQQDWNDLAYQNVYHGGFKDGAKWMQERLNK